jgi:hypothetical protein
MHFNHGAPSSASRSGPYLEGLRRLRDKAPQAATHLLVQELDDACQLLRNPIRHEQHADAARAQVRLDLAPECFRLDAAQKRRPHRIGIVFERLGRAAEGGDNLNDRPVGDAVGGVIEHLRHDLPTRARVACLLDFDEHRHPVGVGKEMVEGLFEVWDRMENSAFETTPADARPSEATW